MSEDNVEYGSKNPRLYYFDQNRRIYEMNGVEKRSPFHIGYFVPIKIVSENEKEIVCEFGTINKRSKLYSWRKGAPKYKVYTEQEMLDEVYVEENRHRIVEQIRKASADVLRQIDNVLLTNAG